MKGAGELPGALRAAASDVMWVLPDPVGGSGDRATAVLTGSIRRIALIAAAGLQMVMMLATWSTLGGDGLPFMAAQLTIAVVALVSVRIPIPAPIVLLCMLAIGFWGYLSGSGFDSVLVFAACWEINFATCIAVLLILRRYVVPMMISAALVISSGILLLRPDFGAAFAVSVAVTQTAIVLALRLGLPRLLRPAVEADLAAAAAEVAERRTLVAQRSSARAAEESRVLHDTAINTLGAIANGGAGVSDVGAVRDQCGRDVRLLRLMRHDQTLRHDVSLREIFDQPRASVTRTGLDDEELDAFDDALPEGTRLAVIGCVRESVTNALKHSGVDRVEIDASGAGAALTITVRDAGRGFSGSAPQGRGIAGSILARAEENGFVADVSSEPGVGTSVVLTIPGAVGAEAGRGSAAAGSRGERDELRALQRRAGGYWALGVTAVGAVLLLGGGTNEHLALYPMLAIMLLCWGVARIPATRGSSAVRSAMLIASTCAVFFLSGAATEFGTVGAIHWQALAPTGPFVLLLATAEGRIARVLGAAAWVVLGIGIAARVAPASAVAAQIVLVAACVGLGFSGVWAIFQAWAFRLGEAAARSRRAAFQARLRTELDEASRDNYRRWVEAGLDSAVHLLREIAEGRREPTDVSTRSACGDEERYLRQLMQMNPELVHLGRALIPALRRARDADIELALRLGGVDAADAAAADEIASTVIRNVIATSRGDQLTASLFPSEGELRLTLVGNGVVRPERAGEDTRFEDLGGIKLLEMTYPRGAPTHGGRQAEDDQETRSTR